MQKGLSGYELKNVGFTGFASGGSKALWLSHELPDDNRLVFCESAIDALSHAVLFPDNRARYASIGGKPNPQQPELIRAACRAYAGWTVKSSRPWMPMPTARKLADVVRKAVALTGRLDLRSSCRSRSASRTGTISYARDLILFFPTARRCLPSPDGRRPR